MNLAQEMRAEADYNAAQAMAFHTSSLDKAIRGICEFAKLSSTRVLAVYGLSQRMI